VARPGHAHPAAQGALLPDVSSTRIREALAARNTQSNAELLAVSLPSAVLAYIAEHDLYSA
jgi:nicotinic acid mononucleotide adenylyltransferase